MQSRDTRPLYTLIYYMHKNNGSGLKLGGFETLAGIQADHLQPLDWLFHYILRVFVEIDCLAEHFDTAPDRTRTAGTLSKALIQNPVSSSHLRTFFFGIKVQHIFSRI